MSSLIPLKRDCMALTSGRSNFEKSAMFQWGTGNVTPFIITHFIITPSYQCINTLNSKRKYTL